MAEKKRVEEVVVRLEAMDNVVSAKVVGLASWFHLRFEFIGYLSWIGCSDVDVLVQAISFFEMSFDGREFK